MTWDICLFDEDEDPTYALSVDWNGDGDFIDPGDNVTSDVIGDGSWTVAYGRDQARQLSPSRIGTSSFSLCDVDATYSPENEESPLAGNLGPGRRVQFDIAFLGGVFPMGRGRIDDYQLRTDGVLSADFTVKDGLAEIQGIVLSTQLYFGLRTGDVINVILDEAGWTGPRDIDPGASFTRFWWAEDKDALTAVLEMVAAEGPPAIAYVSPEGTFTFRDRHHRILRQVSKESQATFATAGMLCDSPAVTGFSFTDPFQYEAGWRDVVNVVSQTVDERRVDTVRDVIWSSNSPASISSGETVSIRAQFTQPAYEIVTPDVVADFTTTGPGTLSATISRTSGQSVILMLTASGGDLTVLTMRLRGRLVPVSRMIQVVENDPGSIDTFGERTYPRVIPWAVANDVQAVAQSIITLYSQRRPTVSLRIAACDPDHFAQILLRSISDRITIRNDIIRLDADFHIEQVQHVIRRIGPDRAPVHSVVFGCEKAFVLPAENPFTFDVAGKGFDQGEFGGTSFNDPDRVFIFDHPTQGQFDNGQFGT